MQNKHKSEPSLPNMILTGHTSQPTYALGWSSEKPMLASGGQNGNIVLWNLEDNLDTTKGFFPGGVLGQSQSDMPGNLENGGTKFSRSCKQGTNRGKT